MRTKSAASTVLFPPHPHECLNFLLRHYFMPTPSLLPPGSNALQHDPLGPTLGDTTLMSSLRKRNLPTSSWKRLPQLFMQDSSTWGEGPGEPRHGVSSRSKRHHHLSLPGGQSPFQREAKRFFSLEETTAAHGWGYSFHKFCGFTAWIHNDIKGTIRFNRLRSALGTRPFLPVTLLLWNYLQTLSHPRAHLLQGFLRGSSKLPILLQSNWSNPTSWPSIQFYQPADALTVRAWIASHSCGDWILWARSRVASGGLEAARGKRKLTGY